MNSQKKSLSRPISIRVTEAQYKEIEFRSKEACMNINEFMRTCALTDEKVIIIPGFRNMPEIIFKLSDLGNGDELVSLVNSLIDACMDIATELRKHEVQQEGGENDGSVCSQNS